MAEVSLFAAEIGKALNFIITSGGTVLDLTGGNLTMLLNNGEQYSATVVSALSGTVQYTVSAGDFQDGFNKRHTGQFRLSFGTNRFYTSTFELIVRKTLEL